VDGGRICVQALARLVENQNSVKHVLENRREFAVRITEGLIRLSMLVAEKPKRIEV
jgi:hypothetical protein